MYDGAIAGMKTSSCGRPFSADLRLSMSACTAACPLGDAFGPRVVLGERAILTARPAGIAFLSRRRGLASEAVEALDDVAEEARLPLLAVGDDVDARVGLLL